MGPFHSAPHLHDERVATIQKQVLNRPDKNAPLCTARPGWMSVSLSYRNYKSKWNAIEMPLYDILEIDTEDAMIVRVEPCVSIGQLTHALNPNPKQLSEPEPDLDLSIRSPRPSTTIRHLVHCRTTSHSTGVAPPHPGCAPCPPALQRAGWARHGAQECPGSLCRTMMPQW